jgi:hypothetical protein
MGFLETALVFLIKTVGTAAAAVVTTQLPRLIRAIERRLGGKLPDDWQRSGTELALAAVGFGEEWAHDFIKSGGAKPPSSEKMKQAIAFFKAHAKGAAKRLAEEKIRQLIMGALTKTRAT